MSGARCPVAVVAAGEMLERITRALTDDGLPVVAVAADAEDLIGACAASQPPMVLLACETVKLLPATKALREQLPGSRVVAISAIEGRRNVRVLLEAGLDGLVLDTDIEQVLAVTVRAVCAGQLAIPQEMRHQTHKPVLSQREKQVLGMVVLGFTNGEIAGRLFLAESTIKSHLSSSFTKLGVRSRSEAAAMILDPEQSLGTGILSITSGAPSAMPIGGAA